MQNDNAVCLPHEPLCISLDAKLAEKSGDLPLQFAKTSQITSKASVKGIPSRPDAASLYKKVELKIDGQQQTFLMPMSMVSQSNPQSTMSRTVPLTPPKALVQGAANVSRPDPMMPEEVVPENNLLKSDKNTYTVVSEKRSFSTEGLVTPRPLLPKHTLSPVDSDGNRILQHLKTKRGRPKKSFSPVKKYKIMNEKRRCRVLKPKSDLNSDHSFIGTIGLNGGTGIQNSSPLQQTSRRYKQIKSKQVDKLTNLEVPLGVVDTVGSSCNGNVKTVGSVTSKPADEEEPFLKIHSVYSLSARPNDCEFNDDAKIPNEQVNDVSECDQKKKTLACTAEKINGSETANQNGQNPLSDSEIPRERKARSLFSALSDLADTKDSSRLEDDCCIKSTNSSKTEANAFNDRNELSGCSGVARSDPRDKGANGDVSATGKLTMNKNDIATADELKNVGAAGADLESVARGERSPSIRDSDSNLKNQEIDKSVTELPSKVKSVNPDIIACAAGLKNILRCVQVPKQNCSLPEKTKPEIVPEPSALKCEVEEMAMKSTKAKGKSLAAVVQSLSGGTSFLDRGPTDVGEVHDEKQSEVELGDIDVKSMCELASEYDRQSSVIEEAVSLPTKPETVNVPKPVETEALAEPRKQVDNTELTKSDKKEQAPGVEIALGDKKDMKPTPQKTVNDSMNEVFDAVLSAETCFELGDFDSPTKQSAYEALSDPGDLVCDLVPTNSPTEDKCEPTRCGNADASNDLKPGPSSVVEHDGVQAEEKPARVEEGNVYPPENVSELYDATTEELDWSADASDSSIAPEDFRILQHAFSSYVPLDDISVALHGAKVINIGDLPLDVNLRLRRPSTLDGLKLSNENPERNLADNARRKQDIREWIETTKAADNPDAFESTSSSPLPPELEIEPAATDSDRNHFFRGICETPPEIDLAPSQNESYSFLKQSARKTFSSHSKPTLVKRRCVTRCAENSHSDDEFFELNKERNKDLSGEDRKRFNRIKIRKWRLARRQDVSKTDQVHSANKDNKNKSTELLKTVSHLDSGCGKKKKGINIAKEERRQKQILRMRKYRQELKLKKAKAKVLSQEHVFRSKEKQTIHNTELKADVTHQTLKESSQKKASAEGAKGHKLSDEERRLRNAFKAREWRKKRKLLLMQGKAELGIEKPTKRRKVLSGEEVPLQSIVGGCASEKTFDEIVSSKAEEVCKSSDAVTEIETKMDVPCIGNVEHDRSSSGTATAEKPQRKRGRPAKGTQRSPSMSRGRGNFYQKGQSDVKYGTTLRNGAAVTAVNNQSRILKQKSEVTDSAAQGDVCSSDVFSFKSDSSVERESTNAFLTNFVHNVKEESPSLLSAVRNDTAGGSAVRVKEKNSSNDDLVTNGGECSMCPGSELGAQAIVRNQIKRGRGRPRKVSVDFPHSSAMSTPIPPASRTKSKPKNNVGLSPISNTNISKDKDEDLNKSEPAPFDMNSNIVRNTGDSSRKKNISRTTKKVQVKRGRGRPRKKSLDSVPLASPGVSSSKNGRGNTTVRRDESKGTAAQHNGKLNISSVKESNSKDSPKLSESPMSPQETEQLTEKRKRGRPRGSFKKHKKIKASDSPDIADVSMQQAQVDEVKQQNDTIDENHLWGKEDLTVDTSFEEEPNQNYEMSMNESDDFYLSMSVTSPPMSPVQNHKSAPIQPNPRTKLKGSNDSEKKAEVSKAPEHIPTPPVLTPEDHAYKLKVLMDKLKSQNEELDKLRAQQK